MNLVIESLVTTSKFFLFWVVAFVFIGMSSFVLACMVNWGYSDTDNTLKRIRLFFKKPFIDQVTILWKGYWGIPVGLIASFILIWVNNYLGLLVR